MTVPMSWRPFFSLIDNKASRLISVSHKNVPVHAYLLIRDAKTQERVGSYRLLSIALLVYGGTCSVCVRLLHWFFLTITMMIF